MTDPLSQTERDEFMEWCRANQDCFSQSAGGTITLRESMVRALFQACRSSWALGHKIYHNANAHEAPMDWRMVRKQLVEAFGDYRERS
jgi:hypothetical protein